MSQAKHTPGPWAAIENGAEIIIARFGDSVSIAEQKRVAFVKCEKVVGKPSKLEKENKANASLIAAAPELLDALRTLVNYGNLGAYQRADAMNAAHAAIARATAK